MDFASTLKPDVYKTVTVILIPGFVFIFPWVIWFFWPMVNQLATWHANWAIYTASLTICSLVSGLILEDLGARAEVEIIDPWVMKNKGVSEEQFYESWSDYLGSSCNDQIVAQRYLRSILIRFKFELSMVIALGFLSIATVLAFIKGVGLDFPRSAACLVVSLILLFYLLNEAKKGGVLLYDLRMIIVKKTHS